MSALGLARRLCGPGAALCVALGAAASGGSGAALTTGCSGKHPPATDAAQLAFARDGVVKKTLALAELKAAAPPETFTAFDPYYNRKKTFRALPLRAVLQAGFGPIDAGAQFLLKASDGYSVPFEARRLLEDGAYIAFEDVDVPGWEPIGPQRANPGPFYLVWKLDAQQSLESYPRPWQLATIDQTRFELVFPHVAPTGEPALSPARRGHDIFRDGCIRCHAINREGGRAGPDLNVPQSIVEYRPVEQIRAYVRDPRSFRYGNMPPHPHLSDGDLDALVAYFRAMSQHKHDPEAAAP